MTGENKVVDRLRSLKRRLGARPATRVTMVPLVEVLESSLTRRWREVLARKGHRLGVRPDTGLTQDEKLWTRLSQNGRRHVDTHLGRASMQQSIGAMLEGAVHRG